MTYGMTVLGDAGQVQISSVAKNIALITKGTHNILDHQVSVNTVSTTSILDIPAGLTNPLLALRPRQEGDLVAILARGSSQFSLISVTIGPLIDWWLFDVPPTPTADYGLIVRDAAGAITFQSEAYPMRVVGTGSSIAQAEPSGRTYAILQGSLSGVQTWYEPHQDGTPANWAEDYQFNAMGHWDGAVRTGLQSMIRNPDPSYVNLPPDVTYGPANFAVIDVTNY